MIKGLDLILIGIVFVFQQVFVSLVKQVVVVELKVVDQVKLVQLLIKILVFMKGFYQQEVVFFLVLQVEKKKVVVVEVKDGVKGVIYKVVFGESLVVIVKKNGVMVEVLCVVNGLISNVVCVGQELKILVVVVLIKVVEKFVIEKVIVDDIIMFLVLGKFDVLLKLKVIQFVVMVVVVLVELKDSVLLVVGMQVVFMVFVEIGIGKYCWFVIGVVIVVYGVNVDGQCNDGIDIFVLEGMLVKVFENGVVIYVGNGLEKFGNIVFVCYFDGKVMVYVYLKSIDVNCGDKVNCGQVLVVFGMFGNVLWLKLYFEVCKNLVLINLMFFFEQLRFFLNSIVFWGVCEGFGGNVGFFVVLVQDLNFEMIGVFFLLFDKFMCY